MMKHQYAIAAWASEGSDNGFDAGESFTWVLQVGNDFLLADEAVMNTAGIFTDVFENNGFGQLLSASFSGDVVVDTPGCTDATACNYDAAATSDDGSCVLADGACESCADGAVVVSDSDGDGVCDADEVAGCTDASACNYNADATDEDGSCYNNDLGCGCDQPAADAGYDCDGNCLADADGDGVCDEFEIVGCQDDTACNFDASATDAGDCSYADAGYDCAGTCLADADGDGVCDEFEVVGCQDDSACNFDASATDAGDCSYADAGMTVIITV